MSGIHSPARSAARSRRTARARRPRPVGRAYSGLKTTKDYRDFLHGRYGNAAPPSIEETVVEPVRAISVLGNQPPRSEQYQVAIAAVYGLAATLRSGLELGQLPRPRNYFAYDVGALETLWWSIGPSFDIGNSQTLRWQAFIVVPPFVTVELLDAAKELARSKHPGVPYDAATLAIIEEGRAVQTLHVGPYEQEEATLGALHDYITAHGLAIAGKHHEIYLNHPALTPPARLKTVVRLPVRPVDGRRA